MKMKKIPMYSFFFLKRNGESIQMSFSKINVTLLVYETLFATVFQNISGHLHYHGYRKTEGFCGAVGGSGISNLTSLSQFTLYG